MIALLLACQRACACAQEPTDPGAMIVQQLSQLLHKQRFILLLKQALAWSRASCYVGLSLALHQNPIHTSLHQIEDTSQLLMHCPDL